MTYRLAQIVNCGVNTHSFSHSHIHLPRPTPHSPPPATEALFVNLAFGLKGYQDILKAEEKQKSKPAREESRGRRKPLSPSI